MKRAKKFKGVSTDKTITEYLNNHYIQDLNCKSCGAVVENLSSDVGAVTCDRCVQRLVAPPEMPVSKYNIEIRPRGWHLKKEYISPSGKMYEYGKEVSNEVSSNAINKSDGIRVEEIPKKARGRPKGSTTKRRK